MKENIKKLEELEITFNEKINELKKIFQKIEKDKENLKLLFVNYIYNQNIKKLSKILINRIFYIVTPNIFFIFIFFRKMNFMKRDRRKKFV